MCIMRKFPLLAFFVATLLVFYVFNISWKFGRLPCEQQPTFNNEKQKLILYWTTFFGCNDFEVGLGSKPFSSCSDFNCRTTADRRLFNESDAVIFHGRNLNPNDLPPPGWRRPEQNFVFLLLESPVHTDFAMLRQPIFRDYFNRTMTYRRDSDIFYPYGQLKCIHPTAPGCSNLPPRANGVSLNSTFNPRPAIQIDLASKNRTVAWFVSNCRTHSHRELLVHRLSQYIRVDTYGQCAANASHRCSNSSECDLLLGRHYRFYLSFENSLCPDYVTEKLHRPLIHGAVPVVYGGANYSVYLPAGSYVNVMDFNSTDRLAQHLHRLMTDDQLYLSYFNWRDKYAVNMSQSDGWCLLCRMLIDPEVKEKMYADIGGWWSGQTTNRTCIPAPKSLVY